MHPNDLADALLDARRYVRTHPDYVSALMWAAGIDEWPDERHARNVMVGLRYIQVDPAILEGYLYATAFELRARTLSCADRFGNKFDVITD